MSEAPIKRSPIDEIRAQRNRAQQNRERFAIIGVIAVVVVAFVGVIVLSLSQANSAASLQAASNASQSVREEPFSSGAPILGDSAASFVLVEFSNFSCPHCADYHTDIVLMVDRFVRTGKARFLFQPMIFDPNGDGGLSLNAAEAAMCAAAQGKFWPMHEALFSAVKVRGTNAFTVPSLVQMAQSAGLDSDAMAKCLQAHDTYDVIRASLEMGNKLNIEGTPTLMYSTDGGQTFTNFEGYPYSVPVDVVARYIEQNTR